MWSCAKATTTTEQGLDLSLWSSVHPWEGGNRKSTESARRRRGSPEGAERNEGSHKTKWRRRRRPTAAGEPVVRHPGSHTCSDWRLPVGPPHPPLSSLLPELVSNPPPGARNPTRAAKHGDWWCNSQPKLAHLCDPASWPPVGGAKCRGVSEVSVYIWTRRQFEWAAVK